MQACIVGLIVACAALYAATRYLPRAWREQIVFFLAGRGASQARMASWFNTEASCGSGCGSGCGSCSSSGGGCAAPTVDLGPTPDPAHAPAGGRRVIKIHSRT